MELGILLCATHSEDSSLELCVTRSEDNEHEIMEFPGTESGQIFPDFFRPLIVECHADSGKQNLIKVFWEMCRHTQYGDFSNDISILIF